MAREHALGSDTADFTLLEYGSYNCPFCQSAHAVVASLRDRFGERMRYVFRHRPITGDDQALRAAELAEYAHESAERFWEVHDLLMKRGPGLAEGELERLARGLGLDTGDQAAWERARATVRGDRDEAQRRGAAYAPTFFINGRRYEGPWDEASLAEAALGSLGHRVQAAALDFARWAPSTGLALLVMPCSSPRCSRARSARRCSPQRRRLTSAMPAATSSAPAAKYAVNGSSRNTTPASTPNIGVMNDSTPSRPAR